MRGVGACAKPRAVRFCKSRWARAVRPQGRQRPHPWRASGSALGIAQGGTVDPDRVALMAQPTEEGLDERFVAEKRLPFRVIEVRRHNRGLSAVAFLHQLEGDG